jgi:hypothetical protein
MSRKYKEDILTQQDYVQLVQALLQLHGIDFIEGVQALTVGLPNIVRCCLPTSLNQEGYKTRKSFVLANLLRYAAAYPQCYGWSQEEGDTPLIVILKNAIFHAEMEKQEETRQKIEQVLTKLI